MTKEKSPKSESPSTHGNKAIKREHYYTKTIDEVVTQLSGAKFFSAVDAKKGYWHVPLDEASSYLTTGSPHIWLEYE